MHSSEAIPQSRTTQCLKCLDAPVIGVIAHDMLQQLFLHFGQGGSKAAQAEDALAGAHRRPRRGLLPELGEDDDADGQQEEEDDGAHDELVGGDAPRHGRQHLAPHLYPVSALLAMSTLSRRGFMHF